MLASASSQSRQLSHTDISQRFQYRQQLLRQACNVYRNSSMFHPLQPRLNSLHAQWPVNNVTVGYCPVQKTASTTWSKVFKAAREYLQRQQMRQDRPANTEDVTFMFVREPYARLLSAYVDKLFCPNTLFWAITGKHVIRNFRSNPSDLSLQCGHDITFLEFIRYVIHSQKSLIHRNGHFVPAHDHCDVCNVNYSYIGHLETLGEDMPFLLNVFQLPANLTSKSFDSHTIIDNARWVLHSMRDKIRKCMTMYEACLRLWKKWHIRGIISKTEPLPVTAEEAEAISMEDFVSLAIKALNRSGSKEERKGQKTEALREAFASIPPEDRTQVQSMLALDFALFGFDSTPEAVFPSAPVKQDDSNSYFDLSQARFELGETENDQGRTGPE